MKRVTFDAKPRKYGSLSHTGRELLSHLQYWKRIKPDAFICNRENRAIETLRRNGLVEWNSYYGVYEITEKGMRVRRWSFPK